MEPGATIGKYKLVSRLGRGGMGEVWLAKSSGFGGFTKTVVLKTLLPEYAGDPLFIEMLANEARICAKLSHPNLIEVFDFSEHDGRYLLAMEHVTGRPLSTIMRAIRARNWELPAWFALRIAWECCRGLECAHDQEIIHCDLSPSNIMVTFTGVTKILDFGVAHTNARGQKPDRLKGKVAYMAPERFSSLTADRRTDIYALGVMLYLLFTGRLPFAADNDAELRKQIATPPMPPSYHCAIAPEIEDIILRSMQRDPAARYQTIGDMLADLTRCLEGQLGAFGQHDVAQLIRTLFDAPDALAVPRVQLATSGSSLLPAARLPSEIEECDSVDILIEPSNLEIRVEQPVVPPRPPTPFTAEVRATASLPPLAKRLVDDRFQDARTSVQSLFGDRAPLSFGHTNVFGGPSRIEPVQDRIEPADGDPDSHEPRRGVFGGYAASRPAEPSAWPWPTSRTKSG